MKKYFGRLTIRYKAFLFDLDGVIVDTAKYHYIAWKRLADELDISFDEASNEAFKGVSRMRCMELLAQWGGLSLSDEEMVSYANRKNVWYVELLSTLDAKELLPGSLEVLERSAALGIKSAICSASKNTPTILSRLGISHHFACIIDGNCTQKAKPDPEVFLLAVSELGMKKSDCVIFEDAEAGAAAGKAEGIYVVGIGKKENIPSANIHIPDLANLDMDSLLAL